MVYVAVQHKVRDYKAWRMVFDNFITTRKSAGEQSFKIWRTEEDPNDLNLLFQWDSSENARSFMTSTELQTAMQEAGVDERPKIQYLSELT